VREKEPQEKMPTFLAKPPLNTDEETLVTCASQAARNVQYTLEETNHICIVESEVHT